MIFKLHDPIEFNIQPGVDLSQYMNYDPATGKWTCFCGTVLSTHHGNRWRHIHRMHPELIQRESD